MGRENRCLFQPSLSQHGVGRQIQIKICDTVVNHFDGEFAVPEPAVTARQLGGIDNDGLQSMALKQLPEQQELWIQVQYEKGKFRVFYHTGEEFASFGEVGNFDFNFQPRYVGIAAFRGIRNSFRVLNDSAEIPAFFEYVKFEPLD